MENKLFCNAFNLFNLKMEISLLQNKRNIVLHILFKKKVTNSLSIALFNISSYCHDYIKRPVRKQGETENVSNDDMHFPTK